jgi:hypothetical protein
MYIRQTSFTYDPAQEEKLFRVIDEQMLPAFRQLPGFVSYTAGLDRAAQRGVSIMVWDSLELAAGIRTTLVEIVHQLEAAGLGLEPAQVYELVRQV